MAAANPPMASAINAAANPDGSGVATVGLTHSPQVDVAAGGVRRRRGATRGGGHGARASALACGHRRARAPAGAGPQRGPLCQPVV
jgi:hypothetical protein